MKNIKFEVSKNTDNENTFETFEFTPPVLLPDNKTDNDVYDKKKNSNGINKLFKRSRLYSRPVSKSRFLRRTRYNNKKSSCELDEFMINDS